MFFDTLIGYFVVMLVITLIKDVLVKLISDKKVSEFQQVVSYVYQKYVQCLVIGMIRSCISDDSTDWLSILAMYEAKNSKICNFCTFRPLIKLNRLDFIRRFWIRFPFIGWITGQNVQKLQIFCCFCLITSKYP